MLDIETSQGDACEEGLAAKLVRLARRLSLKALGREALMLGVLKRHKAFKVVD